MKKIISYLSLFVIIAICAVCVEKAVLLSNVKASTTENETSEPDSVQNDNTSDDQSDAAPNPSDKYIGIWTGENCTLEIGKKDSSYFCSIKYSENNGESTEWFYPLECGDVEGMFVCTNGGKCESVISNDNSSESRTLKYADGTCTILTFDEKLLWIDEKEHFGDDIMIIKNN